MPNKINVNRNLAYVKWTETNDANLRLLVDECRGGTNAKKPQLTFKQIASIMNSLNKDSTTYQEGSVRAHWGQIRPDAQNSPRASPLHKWTEEENENLRSLVDEDQGGRNQHSPPLTLREITILMTNMSKTGIIFKAAYVSLHWQEIRPDAAEEAGENTIQEDGEWRKVN